MPLIIILWFFAVSEFIGAVDAIYSLLSSIKDV